MNNTIVPMNCRISRSFRGPLFQLLVRSRLATPALELLKRRIVFLSMLAWLPLLLLSLVDARLGRGRIAVPVRHRNASPFTVDVPLLIAAEVLFTSSCA